MYTSMMIAGFGGQGIILTGKLLGYAACAGGLQATFLPSYGAEQRGGTARCSVILSDQPIGSPAVSRPDLLVAMNQPSLDKFVAAVRPGGYILINESMVHRQPERQDVTVIGIACDDMAKALGSGKVGNIVMLGAILAVTKAISPKQMKKTIGQQLGKKPELLPLNHQALERGYEEAARLIPECM